MENGKDSSPTDELPVLTEIDERHADSESGDRDPTHEFDTLETLEDTATLRQIVELRAVLEDREAIIASLGERLAATREAVRRRDATERSLRRHLTDADRLRAGLELRIAELERGSTGSSRAGPRSPDTGQGGETGLGTDGTGGMTYGDGRPLEVALRESRDAYAALAAYVDGRRRFWDAQNARIEDLEAKVRELDAELTQRIRREREAIDAAHREARRAEHLARLLAAVRRDLRDAQSAGRAVGAPVPASATHELERLPDSALSSGTDKPAKAGPPPYEPADAAQNPDEPADAARNPGEPMQTGPDPGEPAQPASGRPSARRRVMLCLADTPPSEYPIDGRTMVIGRGTECDITVATHFMSREHARLGITAGRVTIEDLGSRNGVLVNSIRVERAILQNGDFITLGETLFRYIEE